MRRRPFHQKLLATPVWVVEPMLGGLLLAFAASLHVIAQSGWIVLTLDCFGCATMLLAGRWPRWGGVALVAFLVANLLLPPGVETLGQLAILVSVLGLGMRGDVLGRRVLTLTYVALAACDLVRQRSGVDPMLALGLGIAAVWLIGNAFCQARTEQRAAAQAAVLDDRLATARELHDTVAHTLSLISLRAQRAELRGAVDAEDLRFFAEGSAQSVQELRAIMSLLRSDADADPETTRRVPVLSESVSSAVSRLKTAEFLVSLTVDGELDQVPASRAATLDKVLREAVNNVIKHGIRGSSCQVLVGVSDADVTLAVINRVPHDRRETTADAHRPLGVTGMRERVAALGGNLRSERSGNDWITQASLPLGVSRPRRSSQEGVVA